MSKLKSLLKKSRIIKVAPDKKREGNTFLKLNVRIGRDFFNLPEEEEMISFFCWSRLVNKEEIGRFDKIHTWMLSSSFKPIDFAIRYFPDGLKDSYNEYFILCYPNGDGSIERYQEGCGDYCHERVTESDLYVKEFFSEQLSLGRGRDQFSCLQKNRELLQTYGFRESDSDIGLWTKGNSGFSLKNYYYNRIGKAISLTDLQSINLELTLDSTI